MAVATMHNRSPILQMNGFQCSATISQHQTQNSGKPKPTHCESLFININMVEILFAVKFSDKMKAKEREIEREKARGKKLSQIRNSCLKLCNGKLLQCTNRLTILQPQSLGGDNQKYRFIHTRRKGSLMLSAHSMSYICLTKLSSHSVHKTMK